MEHVSGQRNLGALKVDIEVVGLNSEETCDGPGFSPQVSIGDLRSDYLALIMEDADRPNTVYWTLWNVPRQDIIPRNLPKEAQLDSPISGRQGVNARGEHGYAAPCPAPGEEGHYIFRAYGLERILDLDPATATRDDLARAMEGHVQEYGENHVVYSRKRQWSSSYEY